MKQSKNCRPEYMGKRTEPVCPPSMDQRIKDLLKEGPLVAFYFSVAITKLKELTEQISDEELVTMFENLLSPERVRNNVRYIFNRLNLLGDEQ